MEMFLGNSGGFLERRGEPCEEMFLGVGGRAGYQVEEIIKQLEKIIIK